MIAFFVNLPSLSPYIDQHENDSSSLARLQIRWNKIHNFRYSWTCGAASFITSQILSCLDNIRKTNLVGNVCMKIGYDILKVAMRSRALINSK